MKFRINIKGIGWYFVLIPFLYPRGFTEYFSIYKQIMTLWLYLALCLIIVYVFLKLQVNGVKIKKTFIWVLLYFVVMLFETLIIQGGVNEGLQKLFATPVLFMFLLFALSSNSKTIIRVMTNILLFNMILNDTFFSPYCLNIIFSDETKYHVTFLGHVQVCAQMSLLAISIAYFACRYGYKRRSVWLIVGSLVAMLLAETIIGYVTVAILAVAFVFYRLHKIDFVAKLNPKFIFIFGTAIQAIIVIIDMSTEWSLGGRYFVWTDAIDQLDGHWLTGFGVYGVLLSTFWLKWSGSGAMNYAHSEVMQLLLDGGIVLLICYCIMCFQLIGRNSAKTDRTSRFWMNCLLMLFLVIGVVESVSEYNFYYMFLLIMFFLPELVGSVKCKQNKNFRRQVLVYGHI